MKGRLFNLAAGVSAGVSAVLFVAVCFTVEFSTNGYRTLSVFTFDIYTTRDSTDRTIDALMQLTLFGPIVFAILPVSWLIVTHKKDKAKEWQRNGQCTACGYDLRATPDRCPECGTVPTAKGATP